MKISKFDGFRVEIDESNHRADIVLSRPPLNVVLFSQRKVMASQFYEIDKNHVLNVFLLVIGCGLLVIGYGLWVWGY